MIKVLFSKAYIALSILFVMLSACLYSVEGSSIATHSETNEDAQSGAVETTKEYVMDAITEERTQDTPADDTEIDLSKIDGNETFLISDSHYINGVRYFIGDVSADNKISARDALLILKHAAEIEAIKEPNILLADVDLDESITAKDALVILKYSADCFDGEDINIKVNDCIKINSGRSFYESDYTVISSFEEYTAYMQDVEFRKKTTQKTLNAALDAEYFEENSLLAIKDYETSGSIKVNFLSIVNEDGKYLVKFSKYYPALKYQNLAFYEYFIPVAGKDINADNVVIEVEEQRDVVE